ncbi:hypothetical protein A9Q74_06330 [Colwellia sp. 39_35_sub15_T18]|nr:hypothetical protein A9Q74_06330 [Colwellia sp. 39_35_sub15_T18]
MTIQEWLESPSKQRTLLAKVEYLNNGAQTAYLSTAPFVSLPDDLPANIAFDDFILESPTFSKSMAIFSNGSTASRSALTLFADESLTPLFLGNVFKRQVTYLLGDEEWRLSDFVVIAKQLAERVTARNDEYSIELRDPSLKLDKVIDTGTFATGVNAGKSKPICIGEVFNIEPMLEDAATHKYCVNYISVEDVVEVRDNGLAISINKNNADGSFTLNQAPVGRITCDVKGAKPATHIQYPGDVITWLLTTFVGETVDNIADLSALPLYKVGIYQREPRTVRTVIDTICKSIIGYHMYARNGQFVAKIMPAITGIPAHALTLDDIVEDGVSVRKTIEPASQVTINYKQNHTPQNDGLAGGVSAENRELFSQQYQTKTVVNNLVDYPDASPITRNTCLVDEVDAGAVAAKLAGMYSVKRIIHKVHGLAAPFLFDLGGEVIFYYWDFSLSAGRNAIIIGLEDNPVDGEVTVELWS